MNGGFERACAVFGGEAELERILSSMNETVFGIASRTAAAGDLPRPDKPPN
jgi:type I restriction enzyme, R subunit